LLARGAEKGGFAQQAAIKAEAMPHTSYWEEELDGLSSSGQP
jgi:hypothetical protein